jgi:hypothetical protein
MTKAIARKHLPDDAVKAAADRCRALPAGAVGVPPHAEA